MKLLSVLLHVFEFFLFTYSVLEELDLELCQMKLPTLVGGIVIDCKFIKIFE